MCASTLPLVLCLGGAESAGLSPAAARTIQRCVDTPARAVLLDPADRSVAAEAMLAAALDTGIPIVELRAELQELRAAIKVTRRARWGSPPTNSSTSLRATWQPLSSTWTPPPARG
jgi:hypothetical protein